MGEVARILHIPINLTNPPWIFRSHEGRTDILPQNLFCVDGLSKPRILHASSTLLPESPKKKNPHCKKATHHTRIPQNRHFFPPSFLKLCRTHAIKRIHPPRTAPPHLAREQSVIKGIRQARSRHTHPQKNPPNPRHTQAHSARRWVAGARALVCIRAPLRGAEKRRERECARGWVVGGGGGGQKGGKERAGEGERRLREETREGGYIYLYTYIDIWTCTRGAVARGAFISLEVLNTSRPRKGT